jgi:hypothetical protein
MIWVVMVVLEFGAENALWPTISPEYGLPSLVDVTLKVHIGIRPLLPLAIAAFIVS